MRILVVEDDARVARAVKRGLEQQGWAVDVAATGEDGAWLAGENAYDAMVLDVMLPGLSGLELCASLRKGGEWTPILMLTAADAPEQETRALDGGADDFLGKPFAYPVLVARLRALLRRGDRARPTELVVGDLRLDPAAHRVWRGEDEVALTPRQFAMLEFFMRRPGEVLSKGEILEHVWDFAFEGDPNIVEVYVRQLRIRIDVPFARRSLQTVRRAGYRLDASDG